MSQTCHRCMRTVDRACQSDVDTLDCEHLRRAQAVKRQRSQELPPLRVCEAIVDVVVEHLCGEITETPIAISFKKRTPPEVVSEEFMLGLEINGEKYLVVAKHGS